MSDKTTRHDILGGLILGDVEIRNAILKFAMLLSWATLVAQLAVADTEDRSPTRIHALIADLGNDEFIVRERAEMQLLRIGLDAFAELKQATTNNDIEVAQRAKRLLSQFEMIYRGKEDESVRDMVDLYTREPNIAQKTLYLWVLADPTVYPNGEALRTLCRIARFDAEPTLRIETAKCLIASPPIALSKRKDWFRTLRAVFNERDDDELLRLVGDYAALYNDLDVFREEAEKKAETHEKETGTPVKYPVPFTVPEELRNRVQAFTDRLAAFQSTPENSNVQPGHRYDILLFHALAELQDAVGLVNERDRTLEAALAVRTEKMRSENPLLLTDPLDESSFSEHFHAAVYLERRHRFLRAERHLQLIIAEAPPAIKARAYEYLWFVKQMLARYREAIDLHQRCLELFETKEFRSRLNDADADAKLKDIQAAKDFCVAKVAADAGNWKEAKEAIDRSLQNNATECDAVILRYEISKQLGDPDENERQHVKRLVNGVLQRTEQIFQQRNSDMIVATISNQAAWLLANTGGDFPAALSLIRIAVRAEPESPMYLDTLAHVYALGNDYKKAVEVQKEAVRLAPEAVPLQLALTRFRANVFNEAPSR